MDPTGVALVTGAARGLGRAIALEMARRGFDVVAGIRDLAVGPGLEADASKAIRSAASAGALRVERLDVTDLGEYEPPAGLRVLVNNAGFRGRYLPIEHSPLDEWRKTFDTNVFGLVELTQRVIPGMRDAGEGVICNIGSTGVYAPMPFYSVYRSSKAALAAISEGLRIELAPFGIRVIDVPIGGVDTDMLRTGIAVRVAEAVEHEPYRAMALRQRAMNEANPGLIVTSAEDSARLVVEAILTEPGPLRRACDAGAAAMMERVAASTEEERGVGLMRAFGLEP
jgi:NAD(P)-dependent dehydrogenase (short-subunit alcohol dehydrogenase family)